MNTRGWICAALLLLSSAAGCGDLGDPLATEAVRAHTRTAPTSVINPVTGEPVALNAPSAHAFGPVLDELECPTSGATGCSGGGDPCTINPGGCSGPLLPLCDQTVAWSRAVRTGQYADHALEANGSVGTDCGYRVMTGIGGRIELSGGDSNWSTLALEGRQLHRDGTWGSAEVQRFGTDANFALEAWGSVPQGYAIVGVAAGQGQNSDGEDSHDLRTLIIRYRQVIIQNGMPVLTGPIYTGNFGVNPYGPVTVDFLTTADDEVFIGAGFRAFNPVGNGNSRTTTMEARLGRLQ
ncbi:MAG TPA: hypothetical protein VLK84_20690 [Longimicrobium sp.]|nr:hypothetical protein [Longimicrobium sp.]